MKYEGSCHCQAVTFDVELPDKIEVNKCNCSMCAKSGALQLIIPLRNFRLKSGADKLSTYTFNTGVAKHTFCSICGIKAFYTPRSNPDGISINLGCLKSLPPEISILEFDGQNWEQHAHTLAHKSQ